MTHAVILALLFQMAGTGGWSASHAAARGAGGVGPDAVNDHDRIRC